MYKRSPFHTFSDYLPPSVLGRSAESVLCAGGLRQSRRQREECGRSCHSAELATAELPGSDVTRENAPSPGGHGAAARSFSQAIEAIEHLRDQIAGAEREQQLFFEDKLGPYHEMVSLLVQANNAEEAIEYAERAKGRVLLDVLRNGRISVSKYLSQKRQTSANYTAK